MSMFQSRLLLDTNVIVDFLNRRDPYYDMARLLMIAGRVGEFELWVSSSQVTDLVYVLSEGGRRSLMGETLERLRGLRTFVNVFAVSDREIDRALATSWRNPEDALLFEVALSLRADAIVTRNKADFESSLVKVVDCDELFAWLEALEEGIEIPLLDPARLNLP